MSRGGLSLIECCWLMALGHGWQFPVEVKVPILLGTRKRFLPHGHFPVQFAGLGFRGSLV